MKGRRTLWSIVVLVLTLLLASRTSITLAAGAAGNGCGAWQDIPGPSVSGQLLGVAALSHSDVWAVGYSANFDSHLSGAPLDIAVIEHWNGTTWSVIASPQPGNYSNALYKIAAISSSNVWTVGYYQNAKNGFQEPQKTLIEHWDGTSWSIISSPNAPGFFNAVFGIVALAADDIWATGDVSNLQGIAKTLIEHWDGTKWSIVSTPDPGSYNNGLSSLSALSPSDIWAVGSFSNDKFGNNQTLVEHWNGKQWSIVPSPNIGNNGDGLAGVTAISGQDIWAAGYYDYHFPGGSTITATLTEHWDGKQWSIITSPNRPGYDSLLHDVTSLAPNEVWAVGFSNGGPIIMNWDGQQWKLAHVPGPVSRSLWSVAALGPHDVWAVGSFALKLLVMHYC